MLVCCQCYWPLLLVGVGWFCWSPGGSRTLSSPLSSLLCGISQLSQHLRLTGELRPGGQTRPARPQLSSHVALWSLQYHNNNNNNISGRRGEGLTLYFSLPSCKPTLVWKYLLSVIVSYVTKEGKVAELGRKLVVVYYNYYDYNLHHY